MNQLPSVSEQTIAESALLAFLSSDFQSISRAFLWIEFLFHRNPSTSFHIHFDVEIEKEIGNICNKDVSRFNLCSIFRIHSIFNSFWDLEVEREPQVFQLLRPCDICMGCVCVYVGTGVEWVTAYQKFHILRSANERNRANNTCFMSFWMVAFDAVTSQLNTEMEPEHDMSKRKYRIRIGKKNTSSYLDLYKCIAYTW